MMKIAGSRIDNPIVFSNLENLKKAITKHYCRSFVSLFSKEELGNDGKMLELVLRDFFVRGGTMEEAWASTYIFCTESGCLSGKKGRLMISQKTDVNGGSPCSSAHEIIDTILSISKKEKEKEEEEEEEEEEEAAIFISSLAQRGTVEQLAPKKIEGILVTAFPSYTWSCVLGENEYFGLNHCQLHQVLSKGPAAWLLHKYWESVRGYTCTGLTEECLMSQNGVVLV